MEIGRRVRRQLGQAHQRPDVTDGMDRGALLRHGLDDAGARQRRALAGDGDPAVGQPTDVLEGPHAEALGAAMAEDDQAVPGTERRRVLAELEGWDRPRLVAGCPKEVLPHHRAVVAGASASDEQPAHALQPVGSRRDRLGVR